MAWLVFASSYLRLNTLNMLNLKNNVTLFIAEISINRFVSRRDGRASLNFCKRGKQTYFTQIHCKYNYIQVSLFCIFRLFLFPVPIFSPQVKMFFRHCHYFKIFFTHIVCLHQNIIFIRANSLFLADKLGILGYKWCTYTLGTLWSI